MVLEKYVYEQYVRIVEDFKDYEKIIKVKMLDAIYKVYDNSDNIIPYNDLPHVAITSIISFKGNLVYDGMLLGMGIKMGNEFDDIVEREYDALMKYYHL